MKITDLRFYGGARERVCKLGLTDLFLEVQLLLLSTTVELLEVKNANGTAEIRERLDIGFRNLAGWRQQKSGGIDWRKRLKYNESIVVTLGVEVQVSARSDLLSRDLIHLRNDLREGSIDVGLIIVPNNRLGTFLTDRTPSLSDAIRIIEEEFTEAMTYPIVIVATEHDGPGSALPKRRTGRRTGLEEGSDQQP